MLACTFLFSPSEAPTAYRLLSWALKGVDLAGVHIHRLGLVWLAKSLAISSRQTLPFLSIESVGPNCLWHQMDRPGIAHRRGARPESSGGQRVTAKALAPTCPEEASCHADSHPVLLSMPGCWGLRGKRGRRTVAFAFAPHQLLLGFDREDTGPPGDRPFSLAAALHLTISVFMGKAKSSNQTKRCLLRSCQHQPTNEGLFSPWWTERLC
jgi:hypothetical protein